MGSIYRYISVDRALALASSGLRFTPCPQFVDKLEFWFGYAHSFRQSDWESLDALLPDLLKKPDLQAVIRSASISCWTEDQFERYAMWEVYGRRDVCVRVRVNREALENRLQSTSLRGAYGSVIYAGRRSLTIHEMTTVMRKLTKDESEYYHLFFHKHGFYRFEDEYRIVSFGQASSISVDDLIEEVVTSPFGTWSTEEREKLERAFPGRVKSSMLAVSYKT
jgi:hypothetical protein